MNIRFGRGVMLPSTIQRHLDKVDQILTDSMGFVYVYELVLEFKDEIGTLLMLIRLHVYSTTL